MEGQCFGPLWHPLSILIKDGIELPLQEQHEDRNLQLHLYPDKYAHLSASNERRKRSFPPYTWPIQEFSKARIEKKSNHIKILYAYLLSDEY